MNLQEAKAQLEKIITLYKSMTAQGTVSAIERDLMLAHIRKLYDIFLENTPPSVSPVAETPKLVEVPKVEPQVVVEAPRLVEVPKVEPQVVVEAPKLVEVPKVEPQVVVETPKVEPQIVVEAPKVIEVPKVEPPKVTQQTAPPTSEMNIIFEENPSQELSERLANTPIADLTKAFALNDRLLTQNELFGGNKTLFEEAVKLIDSATNYARAEAMMSDFASRYNWLANEDRKKVAKSFVKMVRRRFK